MSTADTGMLCRATRLSDRRSVMLNVASEFHGVEDRQRLSGDFQFCQSFSGAAILTALALDTFEGRPALVLEDFDGDTLEARLGHPFATGTFLETGIRITAALSSLHHRKLAHRALTPAGILLHRATAEVRIIGLGCAAIQSGTPSDSSPWLGIEALRPYLAPEQTGRMNRSPDMRSDLYALGIVFHRMLTGSLPFTASDLLDWTYCHVARTPPLPEEIRPSIPVMLSRIVSRLLAKEPDDRYQSAGGLLHDLRACLRQWQSHGAIQAFELAGEDVAECFHLPRKLYGRTNELGALEEAFERIAAGGAQEMVFVRGAAGTGKSALVGELRASIARRRGLFAAGTFGSEPHVRPFAAFMEAFAVLVQHVLGEGSERAAGWAKQLRQALGPHACIMVDAVPSLEQLIGQPPAVAPLPPAQAREHLMNACVNFIRLFARKTQALVLFLDDLQRADADSLALMKLLASQQDMPYFLPVYACRDRQPGQVHLGLRFDEFCVSDHACQATRIELGPLGDDALCMLLKETLHRSLSDIQPLARLVREKTGANPMSVNALLTSLHAQGLFEFDHVLRCWRWDLARIQAYPLADNMADVMAGKLGSLLPAALQVMEHLACLGMRASADRLAMALDCSGQDLRLLLGDAIEWGLVACDGDIYFFLHERVRDAAYAFLAGEDKARTHLQIGRRLAAALTPERLESEAADVAGQFNAAIALVTDAGERDLLLRLNMLAGRRAKATGAHASARVHYRHAIALLPSDAWDCRYDDAFAARLELAESEFSGGDPIEADRLCACMFTLARSDTDRAAVYGLHINDCHATGRFKEGVATGIEALALLGITWPQGGSAIRRAEATEAARMAELLAGRRPEDLLHLPPATDRVALAAAGLLADILPCAYLSGSGQAALLALKAVNLVLQYGLAGASSCFAFGGIAILQAARGDIEGSRAFSRLGLRLIEQLDDPRMRGRLLCMHGAHVNFLHDSFAVNAAVLENALRASAEAGDTAWAAYAASELPWQFIVQGMPLGDVEARIDGLLAAAMKSRNGAACRLIRLQRQFLASLRETSPDSPASGRYGIEEDGFAEPYPSTHFFPGNLGLQVLERMSLYLFQQYDAALEHARRPGSVREASQPLSSEAVAGDFYHALTMAALHPDAMPERQREFERDLRKLRDRHAHWAALCAPNFKAPHSLISAELAGIEGRDLDAMQCYEQAIRASAEQGLLHVEAMANECAARFYLARGYIGSSDAYLSAAHACYVRWGAAGKLRQLESAFPQLRRHAASAAGSAKRGELARFDALAIMKALQALAGETALDRLLNKLLRVMVEAAGAQKGILVMSREDRLVIEAAAVLDGSGRMEARQLHDMHVASSFLAPASVIQYAWSTMQGILLDNASAPSRFSSDPYVLDIRPKAILCQPIFSQNELLGLIYLENNLVTGAFSKSTVEVLDIIASQAAVALETARLYSDLAEENAQRRRAEQELQHSEAHYRRLFETAKDGIMLIDARSGRIVDVNSRLVLMIGCDYADLMGKPVWQTGPFADAAIYLPVFERLQMEESVHFECLPLQAKGGHCLDVEFVGNAYYVDDTRMFQCNIRDITDRKRAEQHQAVQLAVTRILAGGGSLADAAPALVRIIGQKLGWELAEIWQADGDMLTLLSHWAAPLPETSAVPDGQYRALPFGDDEIARKALQIGEFFWTPGDRISGTGCRASCAIPVRKFEQVRCVMAFYSSQQRVPEDQTISTIRILAGQVGQFMERQEIEQSLVASEERFRRLTVLSSDWYWEQDAALRFTHLSSGIEFKGGAAAVSWLGKARHELDIDWEATDPVAWSIHEEEMQQRLPFMNLEYRLTGSDGRKHWYSVSGEPVFDSTGLFRGYRGVGREITERKDNEALQVQKAQVLEMIAAGTALESVLLRLVKMIEARSDGLCAAVMLLDDSGSRLDVAAAPSMAAGFCRRLEDMDPGVDVTTFGAAMAEREQVANADIAQDTERTRQREAALEYGFHAWCSTPILSPLDAVLGSFELYCRDAGELGDAELKLVDSAARIAGIAVERRRRERVPLHGARHV